MNNVTRFPGTAREDKPQEQLTSAHRFLIYSIQDLCIDISLHTEHKATCHYAGHVHTFGVDITPPEHLAKNKGGDGSHTRCWSVDIYLPPHPLAEGDTLQELADIITALQQYLPTTGGAA